MLRIDRDAVSFLGVRMVVPFHSGDSDEHIHFELNRRILTDDEQEDDIAPVSLDLSISTLRNSLCWSYCTLIVYLVVLFFALYYFSVISLLVQWLYLDHTWPVWRVLFPSLADHPLAIFCIVTSIRLLPLVIAFFPCRALFSQAYIDIREYLHLRRMSESHLKAIRRVKRLIPRAVLVYTGNDGYETHFMVMSAFRYPDMLWVSWYPMRSLFMEGELQILKPQETLPGLITETLEVDGFKLGLEFTSTYQFERVQNQSRNVTYGKDPRSLLRILAGGCVDSTQSLDTVPFSYLSAFLRAFESALPSGSSATLHFTARGPDLPASKTNPLFQSALLAFQHRVDRRMEIHSMLLDIVPERAGKYLDAWDEHSGYHSDPDLPAIQPSTLPIYVTQQDVVQRIRSQCPAFTVLSVRDVTAAYVASLDERAWRLAYRHTVSRSDEVSDEEYRLVASLKPVLRDEEFLTLWKAAVVRAKLLSRWEVVLHKA